MQKRTPKARARTGQSGIAAKIRTSALCQPFREKLSNGIVVVGENIPSVESVAIGVWINFGSRDEKKEENGLTHLVEHMVFKGTEHFTAEELVETIEGRGGYVNAFTTKEFSCYYAKIFKEDIETTIRALSELVLYPKFNPSDLKNEKKVVLSEMQEVFDDPEDWGMDYIEEKIFAGNPLSMPILGEARSLKSFSSADLIDFHSLNFTPDRIVLSVAGNFDRGKLMNLANGYFSRKVQKSEFERKELRAGVQGHAAGIVTPLSRRRPSNNPGRNFIVRRDTGKQAHILLGFPAAGMHDADRYAASMFGVILGDGSSSRLHKNVREKYGLAYSIYSYGSAYSDSGIFGVYACTSAMDVADAEERIHGTINDFVKNGPTREEVLRAKAQLKAGIIFSLENLWDRASLFARDELYYDSRPNLSEALAAIQKIEDVDIVEAAKKYLKMDFMSSLKILPNSESPRKKKIARSERLKSNSRRRSRR